MELPQAGDRIDDRFVVTDRLGQGAHGIVLRCRDEQLRRDVALKLITSGEAQLHSEPSFTDLLREARAQARLHHPNVAIVYDALQITSVRDPDGRAKPEPVGIPTLVSELLNGQSLREMMLAGAISTEVALRLAAQMADAVAHAHELGLIHRDLKPENIVVSPDLGVKVVDFGLAQVLAASAVPGSSIAGTRGYLSPELLVGGQGSAAADVFALAVIAYEMGAGTRPFGTSTDPESFRQRPPALPPQLPVALRELIASGLQFSAGDRPDAATWSTTLHGVLKAMGSSKQQPLTPSPTCPFPGLVPFGPDMARFFFGRTDETAECLELLSETRGKTWLAIEGESGAGKSSMVHAAVLPRLIEQSKGCVAITCRPDLTSVTQAFASALAQQSERKRKLIESELLHGRVDGIVETLLEPDARLIVFVDQLEELFTSALDDEVAHFEGLLANIIEQAHPTVVITTLRSDFVEKYRRLSRLHHHLNFSSARYYLKTLSAEALVESILRPAALAGLEWELGLPERISRDAGLGSGFLPIAAHALRTLWNGGGHEGRLTHALYERIGGVGGALGATAAEALGEFADEEQRGIRALLLSLVRVGSVDDVWTRRRISRPEALNRVSAAVLERLTQSRLLVVVTESDNVAIELAHESLIEGWPQLAVWVSEQRHALARRDELEALATVWTACGRAESALLRGGRLAAFDEASGHSPEAEELLDASRKLAQQEEQQKKGRARSRVALLSLLVAVLSGLLVWAVVERRRVEKSREAAVVVVDSLLDQIDGRLQHIPGTGGAREELLKTTTVLLAELGDSAQDQVLRAQQMTKLGTFASSDGDEAAVFAQLEASAALGRKLIAEHPSNVEAAVQLVRTLIQLRYESVMNNWVADGLRYSGEGVALASRLYDKYPERADIALAYINILRGHASSRFHGQTAVGAQAMARRGVEVWYGLSPQRRTVSKLLDVRWEMARAFVSQGRFAESIAINQERVRARRLLLEEDPDSQSKLRAVAWALIGLSDELRHALRAEEALAEAQAAVELAQRCDSAEPKAFFLYRDVLISALLRRSFAERELGLMKPAAESLSRVMTLLESLEPKTQSMTSSARLFASAYSGLAHVAMAQGDWMAATANCAGVDAAFATLFARADDGRLLLWEVVEADAICARADEELGRGLEAELRRKRGLRRLDLLLSRDPDDVVAARLKQDFDTLGRP